MTAHPERGRRESLQDDLLLDELAADLRPVRVVPRIGTSVAAVIVVWLVLGAFAIGIGGLRSDLWVVLSTSPVFAVALVGLLGTAGCGTVAAVAAGHPDREREVRACARGAGVALGVAGVATAAFAWFEGLGSGSPLAADPMCFRQALLFGVAPAVAIGVVLLRGWVIQPGAATAAGLAGAAALGALWVHLGCALDGARHMLLGHLAVPLVAALVLAAPLAWALRRYAR